MCVTMCVRLYSKSLCMCQCCGMQVMLHSLLHTTVSGNVLLSLRSASKCMLKLFVDMNVMRMKGGCRMSSGRELAFQHVRSVCVLPSISLSYDVYILSHDL